uniref:Uncharacterized protein n=1 Tax=Monodon monoceros TaxID=40151 RepID=A0A8C6CEA9_MONMO
MILAGPEVLAILPQPFPCSLHCSPPGGGGRQAPLSKALSGSWGPPSVDCRLLPSSLTVPLGPRPPPLSSEDYAENGPLGLLRTLSICTVQVDLIYLFCEKEETENILFFAGTQSCTQIKKDDNNRNHSLCTYKDTPRRFRIHERTKLRAWESQWPQGIFLARFPLVDLKI